MKKIIVATSVILVILLSMLVALGLKLNSISNSLAETENAIQELKRSAASDSANDVNVEEDTMSFTEDSLKLVEYVRENAGTEYSNIFQVRQNSVLRGGDWYIPVVRYKNGFPKITAIVYFEKDIGKIGQEYLFLDDAGRLIAYGSGSKHLGWSCSTRGDDKALILTFSNPNHCRNFHAIRSNQ